MHKQYLLLILQLKQKKLNLLLKLINNILVLFKKWEKEYYNYNKKLDYLKINKIIKNYVQIVLYLNNNIKNYKIYVYNYNKNIKINKNNL